jgi:hypothetical protein
MPRNDAAAPGHVSPHIGIHAIDIVQLPGIGISPIADMDAHQSECPTRWWQKAEPRRRRRLAGKLELMRPCPVLSGFTQEF